MAKLADALDLGSSVLWTWGFKSPLSHTTKAASLLHHGFFNAHVAEKRRDTDLQYQSTKQENWHTVVTAQVAADEVSPKLTESYASYSKRIKLEGFRKGKVPLHLVKKMFGKQIEEQVYGPYFQQAISEILKDDKYEPISMPEIENVRFDDAEGLTFQVTFDVRPVFAVQDLQDTAIEKIIYSIDKKDVENTLAALQQQNAMIHTVEGEAQIGHHVVGDIQELDRSGLPIIGRRYEKQTIFLHEEDKEFTPQLLGVRAGDVRRIRIAIPAPEKQTSQINEAEQPKDIHLEFSVQEIKLRQIPKVDDDFAKDLGNYKNLGELKKQLEENLKKNADSESEYGFREAMMETLLSRNDLQIPPTMLERYLQTVVQEARQRDRKTDEKQVREKSREGAERTLKWILIRSRLLEKAGIEVTDEQARAHLQERTEAGALTQERATAIEGNKDRFESLKDQLADDALFAWLTKQVKIKTVKKPWRREKEEENAPDSD